MSGISLESSEEHALNRRDERTQSTSSRGPQPLRVLDGGIGSVLDPRSEPPDAATADGNSQTIGRYALHAEIASGGMAAVHIGRLLGPVGFARTVAIKRLHPPFAKDPEFVAMFLDEARLAARIRHPNVVSTLDVVATEGELFVVLEYVAGESLARLLRAVRTRNELVPAPIAAAIMVGVLHGLHAAHEARDERGEPLRIVHRDVSPHNILVGTDGAAHVIDFGIAKARGRAQVTREGQIKGKLSYMPAEQLLGHTLDHRADVFAASIVFWEALTGQRLFQGTDDGDVYAKVLLGTVEPPSAYAPELSPTVDAIVLRGLARERESRYSTARDMALAIEGAVPLATPSQVGSWVEALAGESLAERTQQIAGVESGVSPEDASQPSSASLPAASAEGHSRVTAQTARDGGGRAVVSARSRVDRTAPTQADLHLLAANGAIPSSPVFSSPYMGHDDSLAAISGAPRRGPRRAALALGIAAVLAIAFLGATRTRWHHDAAADGVPTRPNQVVDLRAAAPPHVTASGAWIPVLPDPEQAPETQPKTSPTQARKWPPAQPTPGVHSPTPTPHVSTAPQPPDPAVATSAPPAVAPGVRAASSASCDPPFFIDADGNKRYYRHCANL
jgi:eukaryotic-like serine/threonine-protein kinase